MQCTLEMVVVAIVLVETLMAEVAIVLVSIGGECSAVYLRGGGSTCLSDEFRVNAEQCTLEGVLMF